MLNSQRTAVLSAKTSVWEKEDKEGHRVGDGGKFDYNDAFYLATVGGARALNIEDIVGNFVLGKRFDAVCWSVGQGGGGVDLWDSDTREDVFQKIMTNGGREDIARVFVNGKLVS